MEQLYKFNPGHDDLVHDMAFDYCGQRLATCSSDQRIKVWDLRDCEPSATDAPWQPNDSWKVRPSHSRSIFTDLI